jgi:hypothetical protein
MGRVKRESTEPLGTGLAVRAPMEWGREFQPSSGGVIFFCLYSMKMEEWTVSILMIYAASKENKTNSKMT